MLTPESSTGWQSTKENDPLILSTSDQSSVFETQWKSMLATEGQMQLSIPFDLPNGDPYSYVKSAS